MNISKERKEAILKVQIEGWENNVWLAEQEVEAAKKIGNNEALIKNEGVLSNALKMLSFYEARLKELK